MKTLKSITKEEFNKLLKASEKVVLPFAVREAFDTIDQYTKEQTRELKEIFKKLKTN